MNRMYNNSMDALNLYSERIAQDMSRFTGGARKGEPRLNRKLLREVGIDVPPPARKRARKIVPASSSQREALAELTQVQASLEKQAREAQGALQALLAEAPAAKKGRVQRARPKLSEMDKAQRRADRQAAEELGLIPSAERAKRAKPVRKRLSELEKMRRSYILNGVAGCKYAINNKDFNYLCDRIKPRVRKPRSAAGLSGVGLSGLGYASGLSGLGYSRASGLAAAGLSGGRISAAKRAQMKRWSRYQDEINKLRNMGYAYRQAQQMSKHILRIN
jgi:hypothetical protein